MSADGTSSPLSYRDAGVDIAAADAFVGRVAALARTTHTGEVVPHGSAYAGLLRPRLEGVADPVLAATCDGVGTKLLVAREMRRFAGLGQDLVAMSVNDLLPLGARPLLFLDYIATGKLDEEAMLEVVGGVARACREVGCALVGGETAEMPGVYPPGDFDLAGFAVGLADGAALPRPESVGPGDVVLALPSTGVHSNGFSLVRKALLERGGLRLADQPPELDRPLGEELLEPTALYVRPVLELAHRFGLKSAAHVTGGGLVGRGVKLLRPGLRLRLYTARFRRPPIFDLIAARGGVTTSEMFSTFNMGLGFLVVMEAAAAAAAREALADPWIEAGEIVGGEMGVELVD